MRSKLDALRKKLLAVESAHPSASTEFDHLTDEELIAHHQRLCAAVAADKAKNGDASTDLDHLSDSELYALKARLEKEAECVPA